MFIAFLTGGINEKSAAELLSRHAYSSDLEWQRNLEKAMQSQGMLRLDGEKSGTPSSVLLDVIAGHLKFTGRGRRQEPVTGSRCKAWDPSRSLSLSAKKTMRYKVVTDGKTFSEVGNAALYLLHSGSEAEARSLLDWMRDQVHRGGGDDPLSGPLFPRFWTVGDTGGPEAIRIAAASLVASTPAIKPLLPAVHAAWEKATDPQRTDLGLLLAWGYVETENGAALKTISSEILAKVSRLL